MSVRIACGVVVRRQKFAYHWSVELELSCGVTFRHLWAVECGNRRTSIILRGVLRSTKRALDDERWLVACLDMLHSEATMSCIPLVIPMFDLCLTSTMSPNGLIWVGRVRFVSFFCGVVFFVSLVCGCCRLWVLVDLSCWPELSVLLYRLSLNFLLINWIILFFLI
jgi:hypothetical protein